MLVAELVTELSGTLDEVALSVVLVVDELSTLLEVFVDELELVEDKLVENELSGVLTELSVSTEQAVRDAVSARVIIIAKKRFINVIPFV